MLFIYIKCIKYIEPHSPKSIIKFWTVLHCLWFVVQTMFTGCIMVVIPII